MKTAKSTSAILIAILFTLSFGATYSVAEDHQAPINQALSTLLTTAQTPQDHSRIAAYYEQEAARLNDQASLHRAMAKVYGKGYWQGHCASLAEHYAQEAKKADALKAKHASMASLALQKQQ